MKTKLSILVLALAIISCSDSWTPPKSRDFNLKFSYGVGSKNVLNTFQNIYTKDLILDGTTTVPFTLFDDELQRISAKMLKINFFSYPDTFTVPTGDTIMTITPYSTFDFEVSYKSSIKLFHWADRIVSEDSAAVKLRELIVLIENIIESNPKYSQLPPAKGGYL